MIVSRGLVLLKVSNNVVRNQLFQKGRHELRKQIVRGDHEYYYRKLPPGKVESLKIAEILGACVWWWTIWHLITDIHEFFLPSIPDPSTWTDEELGIPPDGED